MTIKHLAYRVAHDFSGSVAGLAALMDRGQQVLSNKLNPNNETHHLTISELEMLADFTNTNLAFAEFFAAKAGAVVVDLPADDVIVGDMSLLEAFVQSSIAAGDFAQEFQTAMADSRITQKELEKMRQKMFKHIALQLGVLKRIEAVAE